MVGVRHSDTVGGGVRVPDIERVRPQPTKGPDSTRVYLSGTADPDVSPKGDPRGPSTLSCSPLLRSHRVPR